MNAEALSDTHIAEMTALAEALFAAVAAGDVAAAHALYAPDAVVWHNFDGIEQTLEENARTLEWMKRALPDFRYTDMRLAATPTGFVEQHVIVATNRRGERVAVPACIVATVVEGKVTRIDEYLDSAHAALLSAK